MKEEIKSIIPVDKVYEDALSPAMKQLGKSLESVAKTSRFLLAPFEYLSKQHDRWERYLNKVSEKVDQKNLIEGHPQLVIPTLEGLSLTYENTLLSELFINLLVISIDKTKQEQAHPAFPNIIKQLSRDEAVLLFYLKKKSYKIKQKSDWDDKKRVFINKETIFEEFPLEKLDFPQNIWLNMNHLNSLNIAGTWQVGQQVVIMDEENKKQIGVHINSERRLTEFGELFVKACIPDEFVEL
jgi:Abortive infection alpha